VFALVAAIATLSAVAPGLAQPRPKRPIEKPADPKGGGVKPGGPAKKESYDLGSLTLPKNDALAGKIEYAGERIKAASKAGTSDADKSDAWANACEALQSLVGRDEDVFVPIQRTSPDGSETTVYVSVKKEAGRLIASMPREGRAFYQATYGPKAASMAKLARETNDFRLMGQVMSLYLYTDSGIEAVSWLGTWMLDRAEFQGASRFFSILINRSGIQDVKERTLIKAAYAFHHAGDTAAKGMVFKELARRGVEVRLRGDPVTVADLRDSIDKMVARVSIQSANDSPIYRSHPNRSTMLPGGTPFLEQSWSQKMVRSTRPAIRSNGPRTHFRRETCRFTAPSLR